VIHIHPYNLGSKSAMALKRYLTDRGIRTIVSHRLRSKRKRMIVGWGAKGYEFDLGHNAPVNHPEAAKVLSCKKRFFEHVCNNWADDLRLIPDFTSSSGDARAWADTVVVRATTTGSGGDGITIVEPGADLPAAPLYVRYQKKTDEYRLHMVNRTQQKMDGVARYAECLHMQKKVFVKTEERPEPLNWQIRNHTQGFIFQTVQEVPEAVLEVSEKVMECFRGLDFAALDVIYHKPTDLALVLEGNTAPGLEGPRLEVYGEYLINKYKEVM
jgi:hypothetical protein